MDLHAIKIKGPLNLDPKLPPLPRTVVEVARIMSRPHPEEYLHEILDVVEADPITVHYILKRVNSAYYGLRKPIGNVKQAVTLLGFIEVVNLVMTAGLIQLGHIFKATEQRSIFYMIIRHSVAAARFADMLSRQYQKLFMDYGYATVLLHEMGRIILLYNEPDIYEALWMTMEEGRGFPPSSAEESVFGLSFVEVGEQAFSHWKFPEEMGIAVRHQEKPGVLKAEHPDVYPLALLVGGSCAAIHDLQGTNVYNEEWNDELLEELAEELGITVEEIRAFIKQNAGKIRSFVYTVLQ